MQADDLAEFEVLIERLCAGFEVPVTKARKDAYWTGLRKMSVAQFGRLVDLALSGSKFDSMPTVGAIRKLANEPAAQSRATAQAQQHGPTVQEQLCDYVMLSRYPRGRNAKYSPDETGQLGQAWTYLYREWTDDRGRCAECTGVLIPAYGELAGFRVTVADMLGDPLHDLVLERFQGGRRSA